MDPIASIPWKEKLETVAIYPLPMLLLCLAAEPLTSFLYFYHTSLLKLFKSTYQSYGMAQW